MTRSGRNDAGWPGPQAAQLQPGRLAPQLSRRALLAAGGTAAALLAASPLLIPSRSTAATPATQTGVPGLHGATLALSSFGPGATFAEAITAWESYTSTTILTSKVYYQRSHFPTSLDARIKSLLAAGIKGLLCFKPDFDPVSKSDRLRLKHTLNLYKKAGLDAEVSVWQEPQVNVGHPSAAKFIAAVEYYGPVIRQFYPLVYDASGAAGEAGWTQYYPGDAYVDKVALDYYGHHYAAGERMDAAAALADNASPPKPFGLWEMGDRSSHVDTPNPAQMTEYFTYVQTFMAQRLADGKTNGDIAWYDHGVNAIEPTGDFRVPLWQNLVAATS